MVSTLFGAIEQLLDLGDTFNEVGVNSGLYLLQVDSFVGGQNCGRGPFLSKKRATSNVQRPVGVGRTVTT